MERFQRRQISVPETQRAGRTYVVGPPAEVALSRWVRAIVTVEGRAAYGVIEADERRTATIRARNRKHVGKTGRMNASSSGLSCANPQRRFMLAPLRAQMTRRGLLRRHPQGELARRPDPHRLRLGWTYEGIAPRDASACSRARSDERAAVARGAEEMSATAAEGYAFRCSSSSRRATLRVTTVLWQAVDRGPGGPSPCAA